MRAAEHEHESGPTGRAEAEAAAGFTGRHPWMVRLALVVLAPALALLALEAVLVLVGYGYPTDFFISDDGGRTYTGNWRFAWRFSPPAVATEPQPLRLAGEKAPGTVRVFVLGESAAAGTPDPAYGIARVLEVMLRARCPATRFEVVNAAMRGIDSHGVLQIARECAERDADIFIVYMGNNDVVGPCSPLVASPLCRSSLTATRACLWLKTTRVGQLVEDAARALGKDAQVVRPQTLETFLAQAVRPTDPRRDAVCSRFRANLRDIIEAARRAGARVVVSTVATNLGDCAPLASRHRAGLTEAEEAQWHGLLDRAEEAENAGRWAEAIDPYRAALAIDEEFADLHFRLARCLAALKRCDEAARHYARARDLDALAFRAPGPLNQVVRDEAAGREAQGVFLVDAEAALARCPEADGGVPGERLFYEHAHPTFEGTCRLAEAMLAAVEKALPEAVRAAGPGPVPTAGECAERLALTDWDRLRLARIMARATALPPFTNQSDHAMRQARMLSAVADLAWCESPEASDDHLRVYLAAMKKAPDDWCVWHQFARFRSASGDLATATALWQKVLGEVPSHVEARVSLADALARQGRTLEAADQYRQAIDRRPNCVPAYQGLASVCLVQGRRDEAMACLARAIAVRPDPQGYLVVGDVLARQGLWDDAIAWYGRGLALASDHAALRWRLAEALFAKGDFAEAAKHLEALVRSDPTDARAQAALAHVLARRDQAATAGGP